MFAPIDCLSHWDLPDAWYKWFSTGTWAFWVVWRKDSDHVQTSCFKRPLHHSCGWRGCPLFTARGVGTSRLPCDTVGGRVWLVPVKTVWAPHPAFRGVVQHLNRRAGGQSKLCTQLCWQNRNQPQNLFCAFVWSGYCLKVIVLIDYFFPGFLIRDQTVGVFFVWPVSVSRCPPSPVPSLDTQDRYSA